MFLESFEVSRYSPAYKLLYSKEFEPGSDSRSCSVIGRVRVVLKRTVVMSVTVTDVSTT